MKRIFSIVTIPLALFLVWSVLTNTEGLELGFVNAIPSSWNLNQVVIRLCASLWLLVAVNAFVYAIWKKYNKVVLMLSLVSSLLLAASAIAAPNLILNLAEKYLILALLGVTSLLSLYMLITLTENKENLPFNRTVLLITVFLVLSSSIAIPYLSSHIYPIYFDKKEEKTPSLIEYFESNALADSLYITSGSPELILFASPKCQHCNRIKTYLATALANGELNENQINIVYPVTTNFPEEYKNSFGYPLPSKSVTKEHFLNYTGGRFPLVYLIKDDAVIMQWHYRGFTYSDIPIIKEELNQD